MIFNITMKTPDCLDNAIQEATQDEDEQRKIKELCSKWFTYGEQVTLIVDTDNNTCKVAGTPDTKYHHVITYDGCPHILVQNAEFAIPSEILDWYAEFYGFERSRLGCVVVQHVTYNDKSQRQS